MRSTPPAAGGAIPPPAAERARDALDADATHAREILALLVAGDAERPAARLAAAPSLAAALAAIVDRHSLFPIVRNALATPAGDALAAALPHGWLARQEEAAAARLERQRRRLDDLARVRAALRAAGIEPIVLKGPYAALRFHGGIDRRWFGDLDLLVRPEAVPSAARALAALGLARRSTVLVSRRLTMRFTHAFDFAGSGMLVDLHWRLYPHPSFRVDETRVWSATRSFAIDGETYPVLDDAEEVRFAAVSLFRDVERGAARLRHVVDLLRIAETLEPILDWPALLRACAAEGLGAVAVNALGLAIDLFAAADRLPALARALAAHRSLLVARSAGEAAALLEAAPGALANKRWAAAIYDCPRPVAIAWWAASLPFRLSVHHPGKLARLRRNLRTTRAGAGAAERR